MRTLILLLAFAVPATASPLMLGPSWDGPNPGTFETIVGGPLELGHADFQAGNWRISIEGGYSIWVNRDTLGFAGDTFCAVAAGPCALGGVGTTLQVYQDRPWHLWGESPGLNGRQTSNGAQFVFTQTGLNTWRFGFEDLDLVGGDRDYQDLYGTVTYLGPGGTPTPQAQTPAAVPEPFTIVLVGGALTIGKLVRKR